MQKGDDIQGPPYTMPNDVELTYLQRSLNDKWPAVHIMHVYPTEGDRKSVV